MRSGSFNRLAAGFAAALSFAASAAEPQRLTLDIPSMFCPLCAPAITKALKRVPGVLEVRADWEKKIADVTYDPEKVTPERRTRATTEAGFPASVRAR